MLRKRGNSMLEVSNVRLPLDAGLPGRFDLVADFLREYDFKD